jgi:hypothetical protein
MEVQPRQGLRPFELLQADAVGTQQRAWHCSSSVTLQPCR